MRRCHIDDPFGNRIELIAQPEQAPPGGAGGHATDSFGARKIVGAAETVFETDLKIEDNETGPVYRLVTPAANGLGAANQQMRKWANARHHGHTSRHGPSTFVDGQVKGTTSGKQVPEVLLTPEWVIIANMRIPVISDNINSTIVADDFLSVAQLCRAPYASAETSVRTDLPRQVPCRSHRPPGPRSGAQRVG